MKSTILLIDDDEYMRKYGVCLFDEKYYIVHTLKSGRKGLKYIVEHQLDVVIIDAHLEGLSGLETLLHIKRIKPELPVIVWSGDTDLELEKSAKERGAVAFFAKPVDKNRLQGLVATICEILLIRKQK